MIERGKGQIKAYHRVVAFHSICDSTTVVDLAVELFRTCKDVDRGAIIGAFVVVDTVCVQAPTRF